MRALLTNDDGFDAPGMGASVAAVQQLGWEAVIVAPSGPQSGASRSRNGHPISWQRREAWGCPAYLLNSTPAACVVFALSSGMLGDFDICISGINAGENLGSELSVSGTFGAALEADSYGLRAIAISRQYEGGVIGTDPKMWDWSSVQGKASVAIRWCVEQEDWRVANLNLANEDSEQEPLLVPVSRNSYFVNTFDLETNQIQSAFARAYEGPLDDIRALVHLQRSAVSLISQGFV